MSYRMVLRQLVDGYLFSGEPAVAPRGGFSDRASVFVPKAKRRSVPRIFADAFTVPVTVPVIFENALCASDMTPVLP